MDRTIIAPYKAEEKEMSEKLYRKLQGLMVLYPTIMNEELRQLLTKDMFLKPNHPAFFQVMYFLFRLLDAAEFRRRFFWPVTDKRSEANFRSLTVEYLKYLNDKHNLQWTNIKSYLVVMPGGMKFIMFMLDLVSFVVQELTKQREKALANDADVQSLKVLDVKCLERQNRFFKEYASAYLIDVDQQIADLSKRVHKLKDIFKDMSKVAGLKVDQLLDDKFLLDFEANNRTLCADQCLQPAENILELEKPITNLKATLETFLTKENEHNSNKEHKRSVLRAVQNIFPEELIVKEGDMGRQISDRNSGGNDAFQMNTLIQVFNNINDTIEDQLEVTSDQCSNSNEFISEELESIRKDIELVESQITNAQKELNACTKKQVEMKLQQQQHQHQHGEEVPITPLRDHRIRCSRRSVEENPNPIFSMFVNTPPIKLEDSATGGNSNLRLALQDDFNSKSFALTNMIVPAPLHSARKMKVADHSADLSTTLNNKSKIMDSLQMLRTISKSVSHAKQIPQQNLSALATNWKQRQDLFDADAATLSPPSSNETKNSSNSTTETLVPPQSPYIPFNSNIDQTRIEQHPFMDSDSSNVGSNSSHLYAKNTVVKKLLNASLNANNLSTSPSGRLEPLVVVLPEQKCPKICLNDETLEDMAQLTAALKENNQNVNNVVEAKFQFDISACMNEVSINDISDSVLNDISI